MSPWTIGKLSGKALTRISVLSSAARTRRFDRERGGQQLHEDGWQWTSERELRRRFGANRDWFNTERPGSSNAGHDMWPRIKTDANRRALIEYLKTL